MKVDIMTVIKELRKTYEESKNIPYIKKPMSYALYRVWRKVNTWEKER